MQRTGRGGAERGGREDRPRPVYEFSIKPRISTENRLGLRVWGSQFNEIRGGLAGKGQLAFLHRAGRPAANPDRYTSKTTDTPLCSWLLALIASRPPRSRIRFLG